MRAALDTFVVMSIVTDHRGASLETRRWRVHVEMLLGFIVSLVVLLMKMSIGVHVLAGLVFGALVAVHLRQRRNRLRAMMRQFWSAQGWSRRAGRLRIADMVLFFIFINVMVSGVVDYVVGGRGVFLNIGLPQPIRWHGLSAILLVIDVTVHVIRRAKRIRHSKVS